LNSPVSDPGPQRGRGRGHDWEGQEEPDYSPYSGPLYDDSGWHLDLADSEAGPDFSPPPDYGPRPGWEGNGRAPREPGYREPAPDRDPQPGRPRGRHARQAGPDDNWLPAPQAPPRDRDPRGFDAGRDQWRAQDAGPAQRTGRSQPADRSRPADRPWEPPGRPPSRPQRRSQPEPPQYPDEPSYRDGYLDQRPSYQSEPPSYQNEPPSYRDAYLDEPEPGYHDQPRRPAHNQNEPPSYRDAYLDEPEPGYHDQPRRPAHNQNEPPSYRDAYLDEPEPGYHDQPRRPAHNQNEPPSYRDFPEPASPLAQFSHPDPGPRPDYPAYPESASPLAQFSHPDPGAARYPERRQPGGPAPRRSPQADYDEYTWEDTYAGQDPYAWRAQLSYPEPPTRALPAIMPFPQKQDAAAADQQPSIVRSSGVMAVGTLASRLTGFLRTLVQAYALGLALLANAYNSANTLPNVVYNLALGGILTSVIVPLIVNASKRDTDRGEAYDQRMFTLMTGALLGITLVATVAAAPLVDLYKGSISGSELHLMVIFAYFFIPQIFFYGMSSLIGAVLNARGSFAAPMWTPVVNNVVVIAVLLLYMIIAGHDAGSLTHISTSEVQLLGLGTTLGIVAQTVALIPALRHVGFRWHPRMDFRRAEVNEIGRMAGWMFCYIGATQIAFVVTTNLANDANSFGGFTAYTYAWQLFQMPYAVVGISVITALLPRMSAHAADGELRSVTQDFSAGVRLASVIVVPCSLVLAALGPALAKVFLAHGAAGVASANYVGEVFAVFCLGLLPFTLFQLQLRVFYALHDSRTPALIGLVTMSVNIAANLIALHALHKSDLVAGLGVGFGLANLLGTIIAWRILSQRLGGLDGRAVSGTLIRMHAASIPAAMLAVTVGALVGILVSGARLGAAITIVLGGGGALMVYVLFARALQVTELTSLTRIVKARLGR
jgi:putative peptidoglycan lipid II flippase